MSELAIIGVSHHTTGLDLRERMSFSDTEATTLLAQLRDAALVEEAMLLSTCNRTELYVALESTNRLNDLKNHLSQSKGLDVLPFYEKDGVDAIRHLFRVTASLDAMMVGESQILGQVKTAYARSKEMGLLQHVLHRSCQRAFSVAKQVRTETDIGRLPISASSVAVTLAEQIFGDVTDCRVLLVGTGDMSALAAEHFRSAGAKQLVVVSNAGDHAEEFAQKFDAEMMSREQLEEALVGADIVITATRSATPLLDQLFVQRIQKKRHNRPLLCVDIAVPRNVEADVNALDGVYLYNIDDLKGIADANMTARESERQKAEDIVDGGVQKFVDELNGLQLVPAIASLHQKCEQIRRDEVEKVISKIQDPQLREALESCTQAIVAKILHQPVVELKATHAEDASRPALDFFRRLFGLEV
ncbi:MAG: glutamyl-tRNA reductase [Deltaproteobacteria bacterium CG11_big_fil_rev_8_21_14_0_20_47_16]|nr:MAG: glutamyl-tRNA reductase [Deltaproteobacteria bacterium CG11_big_fil_rev_8_21_14_0_20_47_16]